MVLYPQSPPVQLESRKAPLFLQHCSIFIIINDLENTLTNNFTNTHKYADDRTLDEVVANGALSNMQESTNQVMNLANDNKMMVNPKKLRMELK